MMLDAKATAKLLGVSPRKVYALVRSKQITHYDYGCAIRFEEADVREYRRLTEPARPLLSAAFLRKLPREYLTAEQQAIADRRRRNMTMPPWADGAAIRALYAEARRLTDETGVRHHVDHVIPLQGEFVSGLHVETNMKVIPWRENLAKGNRYEQ